MHFFGIALISVLCVVCTSAQSPSYWVDGSCDKYQQLPAAINEATDMANRAAQRMQDSSDSYFQRVLNKIFNNPPASSNAAVNTVTSGIAAITRVVGDTDARRQTSEIRVYCDDNARWSLQEDIAGDPKPNSGRLDKDKVWIDKTNHMFVTGSPFICQGNTQAETYSRSGPATGEPPKRNTMTICSSQFAVPSTMNVATLYGKSPDPTDFTKINSVSTFGALVSVTVLHELTHCYPWRLKDVKPDPYGYDNIIKKTAADAINNAENFAFFGLFAILKDKGFELSFNPFAKDGTLTYNAPQTARALMRRWIA